MAPEKDLNSFDTSQNSESAQPATVTRWFGAGDALGVCTDGSTVVLRQACPGDVVTPGDVVRAGSSVRNVAALQAEGHARRAAECRHFGECPGCRLLHVTRQEELRYKRVAVAEMLYRFAGVSVNPERVPVLAARSRFGVRHRVRLRLSVSDGLARVALSGHRGLHASIPDCPIATEPIRRQLSHICSQRFYAAHDGSLHMSVEHGEDGIGVLVEVENPQTRRLAEALVGLVGDDACVAFREGESTRIVTPGRSWPHPIAMCGIRAAPTPEAWSQTAPDIAAEAWRWVGDRIERGSTILDATCGRGGLSHFLARSASEVVGVDINYDAVLAAQNGARLNGIENAHFRGGAIGTVAQRMYRDGARFDSIVINPMRTSLGADTMQMLARICSRDIFYLAPAPRAGAADLKSLWKHGFVLRSVGIADLHPGTANVMLMIHATRHRIAR